MFWKLVPEDVLDTPSEFTNADWIYVEREERQNGSGNGKNLDKERMGSNSVAGERIRTKGIWSNIRE